MAPVQPVLTMPPTADTAPRPQKSSAAFRTISEVADELDIAQHVLRFWESKFPQVRPLKRGGGRRYYRPEDVDLLRQIRSLLYDEGYTIKGAQKLLRARRAGRSLADDVEPSTAATMVPPEPKPTRHPGALNTARSLPADMRQQLKELRDELMDVKLLLRRAQDG